MRPYSQRHLHKDRKIKNRTGGEGGGGRLVMERVNDMK